MENLDDKADSTPSLSERISVMRPQLIRLGADILCLQEINGQEQQTGERTLSALAELIQGTLYESYQVIHTVTTEGHPYDERNLVVLSRFPVISHSQVKNQFVKNRPKYQKMTAIPGEDEAKEVTWERPVLYMTLDLGAGRTLHLVTVHLKSKIPSSIAGQMINQYTWKTIPAWAEGSFISDMKRVGQALEVRMLLDKIFDDSEAVKDQPLIVVCGDFNGDMDSVPVKAIRGLVEETGNPQLLNRIMIPCELTVPDSSRYTLLHLGKGEILDHILVSRALLAFYRTTEIHNENLPDESGAFRTDVNFPESDHAPIVAEFEIPSL
jgi:endonuclease/exonuclease/phosphatase family metal-dependent hydrolase